MLFSVVKHLGSREHSRSGEKHSTASRVLPYTSFVLYSFLRALQQNRAQSRLLYLLIGGCCLKIRDVCGDFELYFKVHNSVSVHPKSIILGQMTNLNMIFHVVVSVYRLVKS